MSRLRQPLAAPQAVALLFSGLAFGVAQHWTGSMSPAQFVLVLALLVFLIQPVSYLVHELGHGVAACRLGARQASIMVGRGPWLRFSLGRIRVNFSLLPSCGVMIGAVCRYATDGLSWRSRALIALSGPLATLLELIAGLCLAELIWHRTGTVGRNVIVLSLIGLVSSLIVNLIPFRIARGGAAVSIDNDGAQARRAFRLHGQGAPARGIVHTQLQLDIERTQTSVPPPSSAGDSRAG